MNLNDWTPPIVRVVHQPWRDLPYQIEVHSRGDDWIPITGCEFASAEEAIAWCEKFRTKPTVIHTFGLESGEF